MKINKKKHLEIAIEDIPRFESPKIELEQYPTSAKIAADLLWNAKNLGDITNKSIFDLGCGTGVFALSALLSKAKSAAGIDIDSESIDIAKNTANGLKLANYHFFVGDVYDLFDSYNDTDNYVNHEGYSDNKNKGTYETELKSKFDTIITNPPFGAQSMVKKGADRIFMKLAMKLANVVYSFHMAETEEFVTKYYENLGGLVTHKFSYDFPLLNTYDFHTQESQDIEVIVLRVIKNKI